jgi:flagellar P-ring protein precursor FlgI
MPALLLNLNTPDFTTALRLTQAIDAVMGPGTASAIDASTVQVNAPKDLNQRVGFMSAIQDIRVDAAAPPARVIVNSRTGTIVIGEGVRLSPAAVSHGSMTVKITEGANVTPGTPAVVGEAGIVAPTPATVTPTSQIDIKQDPAKMFLFAPGVLLSDIVNAVNSVGASPSDLVAILDALKQAGSLRAELIII